MTRASPIMLALGGLAALAAALGIGRFVYTPILPAMVDALGLSKSQAGLIASANFVGYLAGALIAATPQLPGSRRNWLLGALLVSSATTALMGAVSSLPAFLLLRLVGGAASAFVLVFASALVLDRLTAAGRGGLAALHFAGVGVGIAVSAALVAALTAVQADWRALWFCSGALSLLALLVVLALVRPAAHAAVSAASTGAPTRRPAIAPVVIAYGLFGFGYVITATFLVAIVRATPSVASLEPWVWMLVGIAAAPSVALWAMLARRVGVLHAFALACLAEAVGVAGSVLWSAPAAIVAAAALLGGTFMGITALGLMAARERSAADPRRVLALMTASFGLGQIVGPLFAGFLYDRLGSFTVASFAAALALLAAALLALRSARAG
jgi:predicted MFS family arabinose efflux permease